MSPEPAGLPATIRASTISGVDGAVRAAMGFVVTIILARQLLPSDFGVLALGVAFIMLASVVIDFGLSTALIQQQQSTRLDESTAFYFNVAMSVIVAVALVLSAPRIAAIFGQSELSGIIRLMAASLVLATIGSIHTTLLTKQLDFRRLLFVGIWSVSLSGAVAIGLASRGYGAWSLAWQAVAQAAVSTALLWMWNDWRPAGFSLASLRRLTAWGRHLVMSGLIEVAYTHSYTLLIGKQFSTTELGLYTRAQATQQLPVNLLANVVNRVALPTFSRTALEPALLGRDLASALRLVMLINLPLMAGLAVTAHDVVELLFGANWRPAAPILRVMCIMGALWPLHLLNLSALLAQGHSRLFLRLEVLKKSVGVSILLITISYGLHAVVWGQAAMSVIAFFMNAYFSGRMLGFGAVAQLRALIPCLAASLTMAAIVAVVQSRLTLPPASALSVLVPLGLAMYAASMAAFGPSQLREIAKQVKSVSI